MKVVFYFHSMSAAGGIERVVSRHIDYVSQEHEVTLITKDNLPSFYALPSIIDHKSLNVDFTMNMKNRLSRIVTIAKTLLGVRSRLIVQFRSIGPDVIYVASPLNLFEVVLAGVKTSRIMVTEHSSFSAYNRIYKQIISWLYPRVGLLMVPTKLDSEEYLRRGICNSYIPNPLSFFPNELSDLSGKWALCVGRFTDDKRHDLLLDIWHLSGIQRQGWKLRIIGKGEREQDLRKKILALGLNQSVFIEGPTTRILDKYFASSIFLLTSRAEGFGLVLAEAMACGVPCICFDCPSGPRDIVEEGVTGRLLKEGDIDGYVKALRELAMSPTQRIELGEKARASVKKFRAETVGVGFMKVFREAFDKRYEGN